MLGSASIATHTESGAVLDEFVTTDDIGLNLDETHFGPFESPIPTPEPGTATMLGLGLMGLAASRRPGVHTK